MVMDMFEQRMVRRIPDIETLTAEQLIRVAVPRLIQFVSTTFFGKSRRGKMIAEGQSDAALYFENFAIDTCSSVVRSLCKCFKEASISGEFQVLCRPRVTF